VKVLILHQFYNTPQTGGSLRSYYLAKALAEKGIKPIVITTHNQSRQVVVQEEGIEVHYLPVTYSNKFNFVKRIYSFISFVVGIVNYAGKFKDADVCYAISTPLTTGVAALWIKLRYKIPFYFEVGDLWPEAPIQLGVIKNPLLKLLLYRLEKLIYQQASSIVALSLPIKEAIQRKAPSKTVHVIPNMADTEFFQPEPKQRELEEKFNVVNKFVVSYIGTLGFANGLDALIDYARACAKAELPVQFIMCGEGAEKERLQRTAENLHIKNISFVPFQNRQGVKEVMNVTDAMLVCFRNAPVLETGSPNKFFDGLAAGKLMIVNFKGWIKEEVEQVDCGFYIRVHHPEDMVTKLKVLLSDAVSLLRLQANARRLAEEKFSRIELCKQFQKLFLH